MSTDEGFRIDILLGENYTHDVALVILHWERSPIKYFHCRWQALNMSTDEGFGIDILLGGNYTYYVTLVIPPYELIIFWIR
jgi:hypothetical protein